MRVYYKNFEQKYNCIDIEGKMFRDEFKKRYTTIPLAIDRGRSTSSAIEVITHQHKEVELISMTEGSAVFFIDSQSYSIKKGDILLIPPYALHRARTSANEVTSYDCICFDLQLLCDEELKSSLESQAISREALISRESDYAAQLQEYIVNAVLACETKEPGWELAAVGNMSLLFGILKENGFFTQSARNQKDANFGKDGMMYIIDHYSSEITSRDAADALYMTHSCFCRSFKKTFGCCFTNYILAYRLDKAKVYLANTTLPVTEVAYRV